MQLYVMLVSACAGAMFGLLLSRKRGPFGIFRFIKNFPFLFPVTRCETCTILWSSFIMRATFGIIPSLTFFVELLAVGGLALAIAGLAQSIVEMD